MQFQVAESLSLRKDMTVNYSKILELKRDFDDARSVELPEFGYICPNQFAGDDEELQHPALDEMLPADEATAAAQEIANQLGRPVKVEYQNQFWTRSGFEAPHRATPFA
jgi:hypothetical protein